MFNKKQKFSIKKFTVGVVSVCLGFSFVESNVNFIEAKDINIEQKSSEILDYRYVAYEQLTEEQKMAIIKGTPTDIVQSDKVYYFVYKNDEIKKEILPNTGVNDGLGYLLSGLGLLVLAVGISRNKKKVLSSFLVLSLIGTSAVYPLEIFATNGILSKYNKTIEVKNGELINPIISIPGYKYLGYYLVDKVLEVKDSKLNFENKKVNNEEKNINKVPNNYSTIELPKEDVQIKILDENLILDTANLEDFPVADIDIREEETREEVSYSVERVPNNELFVGDEQVVRKGVNGERTIVTRLISVNGKVEKEEVVSNTITKEAVNEIVHYGTKEKVSTDTNTSDSSGTPGQPDIPTTPETPEQPGTEQPNIPDLPETPEPTPQPDNEKYEPQLLEGTLTKRENEQLTSEEVVAKVNVPNAPKETTIVVKQGITLPTTVGRHDVPVEITYPDGTKDEINVPVEITKQQDNEKYQPTVSQGNVPATIGENPSEQAIKEKIQLDQNKGVITTVKMPSNESAGIRNAVVTVRYEDGTEDKVNVPIEFTATIDSENNNLPEEPESPEEPNDSEQPVTPEEPTTPKQKDNEKYEPVVSSEKVKTPVGIHPDKQLIKDKVTLEGGGEITDVKLPTETTLGERLALVTVTYPDTTTDTVKVKVKYELDKKVEFRNVSVAELYKVTNNGENVKVNNISSDITDPENYVARIINDGKELILPVNSIVLENNNYAVNVEIPELITYDGANNPFKSNYKFMVAKSLTGDNIYNDFGALINAMKGNSSGTFILGSNVYATTTTDSTYLSNFTGTLKSYDGQRFAIYNLTKPLVANATGATFENIDFKNVNINSNTDTATVAQNATNSNFIGLKVDGNLSLSSHETKKLGGIVAIANGNNIERVSVNLNIKVKDVSGNSIAFLLGQSMNGTVKNSYVSGNIEITGVNGRSYSNVGYLIGATFGTKVENIIIETNQQLQELGRNYGASTSNIKYLGKTITKDNADEKLAEWKLVDNQSQQSSTNNSEVSYSDLSGYEANRETAYYNAGKLMPLYDRKTIVNYGNLIDTSSNLYSKKIENIFMMTGKNFTSSMRDINIDKILVKYNDNTFEILNINGASEEFKNTGITEFKLENGLIFTPYEMSLENNIVSDIANEFSKVTMDSEVISKNLKLKEFNDRINQGRVENKKVYATTKNLYLDDSLAELKNNINSTVANLINSDHVAYTKNSSVNTYLKNKLLKEKEKLAVGMAYINKLYNINFGNYNIKNLMLFNQKFYKDGVKTLDNLIKIGSLDFDSVYLHNNYNTFDKIFSVLDKGNLIEFLNKNRELFVSEKDNNTWLKESTKAFVHEEKSKLDESVNVDLYNTLISKERFKNYLLPLLSLKENNVYVVTFPYNVMFGGYGRSVDQALDKNSDDYRNKVIETNNKIIEKAKDWAAYMDLFMMLNGDEGKRHMANHLTESYDGYFILDSNSGVANEYSSYPTEKRRWATAFENDYTAIKDFFGPINRYYGQSSQSAYTNNNTNTIRFDNVDVLDLLGGATLGHELVHNYDTNVILGGYGHREGQDKESYALGLLESLTTADSPYYGFNFMYNITGDSTVNHNISRFTTKEDLQNYMKGLLDTTYLLDSIESDIILTKYQDSKNKLFKKVEMSKVAPELKDGVLHTHANDLVRDIRDDEWVNMTLNGIEDLVENNLIAKSGLITNKEYLRDNQNNYYYIPLTYPIYAAYQNDTGTVGGLMFRMTAFEMLAEYGWDKGFLGYASNKYKESGKALTDDVVFKKIFEGTQYSSYKEFKKDMYKQRFAKKDSFKAITINYKNQEHIIDSYDKLKNLLDEAIREDITRYNGVGFERERLKKILIKAFNKVSNDFRESIFKN